MMGNFLNSNIGVAIDQYDNLWCWGDNTHGQLGSKRPYAIAHQIQTNDSTIPLDVPANFNGYHVATSDQYSKSTNKLWIKKDPQGNPIKVTDVSIGNEYILAIQQDTGFVFGWGKNSYNECGSLGFASTDIPYIEASYTGSTPATINDIDSSSGAYWITQFAQNKKAKYLSAGTSHSLVIIEGV